MDRPILLTGGTGTLGRAVHARLHAQGCAVRILSRRTPAAGTPESLWATADLRTGSGLDAALRDVAVVIHAASDPRHPRTDPVAARNLLDAARAAGEPHIVNISIVGVDQVPLGYYRAKLEVEELIAQSGLPWTTLRTTQFHDLIATIARVLSIPRPAVAPAGVSLQPVAVDEVAARLTELCLQPPAGRVPDLGGPRISRTSDLVRSYLRARGRSARVVPLRLPGRTLAGFRAGGHLAPNHALGQHSFEDYLAERFA